MLYFSKLFLCFIIFSIVGWILEVGYGIYLNKKIVNRGFLFGPVCPIYGLGCVLLYIMLSSLKNNIVILIVASMLICSIVEYLSSYLLEKIFHVRWWDYDYMKFNINGRICLEMMIPFGILGVLVVKYLIPETLRIINLLPTNTIYIITAIILSLFIIDSIVSIFVVYKFNKNEKKSNMKDNTEELLRYAKKLFAKKLKK